MAALPAWCATDFEITANVSITNTPAGLTSNIVVNAGTADTRNWTNNAAGAPSTSIQITNTPAASVTNLINHFILYPVYSVGVAGPRALFQYSTNASALTNFTITAPRNTNLTVTIGGGWASVSYTTQFFAAATAMLTQTNAISAEQRTNAANAIVNFLAAISTTNVIPLAMNFLRNYTDTNTAQTVGNKTFIAPVLQGGRIVNATNITGTNVAFTNIVTSQEVSYGQQVSNAVGISGVMTRLTNGYWINAILDAPINTNLVNYGNAIRSEGTGGNSLQVGSNALARGTRSVAIGNGALATNADTVAIGTSASATNQYAMAIGNSALAQGVDSFAVGRSANASTNFAMALGQGTTANAHSALAIGSSALASSVAGVAIGVGATDDTSSYQGIAIGSGATVGPNAGNAISIGQNASGIYSNSMAIGPPSHSGTGVSTTATNQIRLGTSSHTVSVPGVLSVEGSISNYIATGTNRINARLDYGSATVATLINGYNSAVPLGNFPIYKLAGPSGAYTNRGFISPGGPQRITMLFTNPVNNMTIMNEDGGEFDTNRIRTTTGGLINYTNNPVCLDFWYDPSVNRWQLLRALP